MSTPTGLRLEFHPISKLVPAKRNPKLHVATDIQASIRRFGFADPALVDGRTGRLIEGHGRREALLAMMAEGKPCPEGLRVEGDEWLVPVLVGWSSKNDVEAEAYLLAHNQLGHLGGWDNNLLAESLQHLVANDALEGVGFDNAAIQKLLDGLGAQGGKTDPDTIPAPPIQPYVEKGHMYALGEHRLICGDSTDKETIDLLMAGEQARICWTDPPWNVAYGENNPGPSWKHRTIANDNMGEDFGPWLSLVCAEMGRVLMPGAMVYLAMSAQEWPAIHAALTAAKFHWSSTIIWAKDSLVLSRKDYHTQYEPIWYGWKEGARLHPLEDRKQSDLWEIPRPKSSDEHPTMKPVELIARSLLNSSNRDDIVYEPFSGSGSTIIAAEQTGRRVRAIELEPKYVQVALERWEKFTGKKAERVA